MFKDNDFCRVRTSPTDALCYLGSLPPGYAPFGASEDMKGIIGTLVGICVISSSGLTLASENAKTAEPLSTGAEPGSEQAPRPAIQRNSEDPNTALLFNALDENKDGTVSHDELARSVIREVSKRCNVRFSQLDHNRDGKVTRREVQGMSEGRFHRFDLDRNGFFTLAELSAVMRRQAWQRVERIFAQLDADRDRVCTHSELGAHRRRVAARQQEQKAVAVALTSSTKKPAKSGAY
jgi:Ca2+-binding EF-hand superfamily protein